MPKLELFNEHVEAKYLLYNSVFMNLPFDGIKETGVLLPLFNEFCVQGFKEKKNPSEIINNFFDKYLINKTKTEQLDLLFKFIQYVERQIVLFDAIEEAAFKTIHNLDGLGSLSNLNEAAISNHKLNELKSYLEEFKVRIVLTAHPTQFYPGSVLGIINDLTTAISDNNLQKITNLLAQLGKTPFFKQEKPSPYDEAVSLIWFLDNVYYESFSAIYSYIHKNIFIDKEFNNEVINIGFWPGGDRDGNPFVTPEITLKVCEKLKYTILKRYYNDIKILKRKLTFKGVEEKIQYLEDKLYHSIYSQEKTTAITLDELNFVMNEVKELIILKHESLYLDEVKNLLHKIHLFGFHFANLDIRQDSRVHHQVFTNLVSNQIKHNTNIFDKNFEILTDKEKVDYLSTISGKIDETRITDENVLNTIKTIKAIKTIQKMNGEKAANRYIISNNQTALNVMELFAMLKLIAFDKDLTVDIVPLFETITDLENAIDVMDELYANKAYKQHLIARGNKQTIMLGFSDGTKDGGYLMANWAIFKAKEQLTAVSRKYGIKVIFFDGRGGPPSRGGGKTHQFYASLGPTIESKEIQVTIQGQTISANFGTIDSSKYKVENLISAGILNKLNERNLLLSEENVETINQLAQLSYEAYTTFKKHPKFLPYLENISPLQYYAKANIGSRPSKRGHSATLLFSDLRAIPFVSSWSQLKQNVPGFYGVGTALLHFEKHHEFDKVIKLYQESSFFKALIENSMMSLSKTFFDLTQYLSDDNEYGDFWKLIYNEYQNSKRLILKLTGYNDLMENDVVSKSSIAMRESIVLPLLTIQQYGLKSIADLKKETVINTKLIETYEKMVTRSLFGNINASRNSA